MFVDDNTIIVYKKWPLCSVYDKKGFISFPTNNSCTFKKFNKINNDDSKTILLINPSLVELMLFCVYIKRTKWNGKIAIMFKRDNKLPPFRLVNDN
ncbi:hypothetical protein [Lumpy skin disease virus]|uniref:LS107 n=1 Tax=Lumpy skin disease virus TaxID=59509 RepID=A0A1C9HHX6_LSDV|nr:hypothetical protein [Lumpy skin disease virus]AOO78667.1 hypothetical protein [Lumpy skin disease virus]AOO78826.1 hypothetical protein [Lumpy skin disease virus]AOO78984.1 hypothetical protein [Lumpy skin disease virus]AVR51544.1 hypothetical protein [Lumpy skin disease virus]